MSKNDEKIKELLDAISKKKKEMGSKPRGILKTNGLISVPGFDKVNINTLNTLEKCVVLAARAIGERANYLEACKLLEIDNYEAGDTYSDALEDLKQRAKIITWDIENKKLQALEHRLKDLRSADAKTEDALTDISKDLGL